MYYIDPHIHMVSRVTDDYERIAQMGCVAVSEPACWAGIDRGSAEAFRAYIRQLIEFEPKRARVVPGGRVSPRVVGDGRRCRAAPRLCRGPEE